MAEREKLIGTDAEIPGIKETRYDDGVNISPEMSAPEANVPEAKKVAVGGEVMVSTLVHLLGIPNKNEFKILDKKIDLVLNRLNSLSAKVDAVAADLSSGGLVSALTRIDEQLLSIQQNMDNGK